jgi:RNA polymerase-binding transcription factor DksA
MPDLMDRVQQHAEDMTSDALAAHAQRPRAPGLTHCEHADCAEPIAPQRTALGARLCLDCQTGVEAQRVHQQTWGRR